MARASPEKRAAEHVALVSESTTYGSHFPPRCASMRGSAATPTTDTTATRGAASTSTGAGAGASAARGGGPRARGRAAPAGGGARALGRRAVRRGEALGRALARELGRVLGVPRDGAVGVAEQEVRVHGEELLEQRLELADVEIRGLVRIEPSESPFPVVGAREPSDERCVLARRAEGRNLAEREPAVARVAVRLGHHRPRDARGAR